MVTRLTYKIHLVFAVIILSAVCISNSWSANMPCTQYANIAPLPGGGIALDQNGKPDGNGAIQMNIPVAYTPGENYFNIGVYSGEYLDNYSTDSEENGSGIIAFGFGTWPRFYGSAMAVSHWIATDNKSVSMQLQIVEESKNLPALAIGVQDVLRKEWKQYHNIMNCDEGYYAVATKRFAIKDKPLYASLGYGCGRFMNSPFAGLSYPVNDNMNLICEYDGYQINGGLAWRPSGRYGSLTFLAGYNGKCGKLLGGSYTGTVNSSWAVPFGLFLIYGE